MKKLYHYPLCPFSRQIRILLKEYDYDFNTIVAEYWNRDKDFLSMSPSGELPVLVESSGLIISDIYPILEYIIEYFDKHLFVPQNVIDKNEMRRLISWFNSKFFREVTKYLLNEKVIRLLKKAGPPRSELIRAAKSNLNFHLSYLTELLEIRDFVASENITIADFVAAAHLSVLDYFNEIDWSKYPKVQHWYSLIKSRPSFRPILRDSVPGFAKPAHYELLDF